MANTASVAGQPSTNSLSERYPRVSRYLGSLPKGMAAYPNCKARSSIYQAILAAAPSSFPRPESLPSPVRELLSGEAYGLWIPEVHLLATILAIGDVFRLSTEEHFAWILQQNREMFNSIVYRAIMAFFSPGMLLEKAGERWGNFHQGSTLEVRPDGESSTRAYLNFPAGLWDAELAGLYAAPFIAGLERVHVRDARVVLQEITPTRAEYRARWS
jgi:hypothetical protein